MIFSNKSLLGGYENKGDIVNMFLTQLHHHPIMMRVLHKFPIYAKIEELPCNKKVLSRIRVVDTGISIALSLYSSMIVVASLASFSSFAKAFYWRKSCKSYIPFVGSSSSPLLVPANSIESVASSCGTNKSTRELSWGLVSIGGVTLDDYDPLSTIMVQPITSSRIIILQVSWTKVRGSSMMSMIGMVVMVVSCLMWEKSSNGIIVGIFDVFVVVDAK